MGPLGFIVERFVVLCWYLLRDLGGFVERCKININTIIIWPDPQWGLHPNSLYLNSKIHCWTAFEGSVKTLILMFCPTSYLSNIVANIFLNHGRWTESNIAVANN